MSLTDNKKLNFKNLIAKDLGRAIIAIKRELDPHSPLFNNLILNRRRYFQVEHDFNSGTIQIDERDKVFNQISNSLISLIEEIEENDIQEYNNIQIEIEKFHDKIKKYEESSQTIESAIHKEGEEIKTFLISGINTLESASTSMEAIADRISDMEKSVQENSEKHEDKILEIISILKGILNTMTQNKDFQVRLIDMSNILIKNTNDSSAEISYSVQKQTQIYADLILNLIDNNAINNERLIAALESMKSSDDTK